MKTLFNRAGLLALCGLSLFGLTGRVQAQTVGAVGSERLSPTSKLSVKANGWLSNGAPQGSEYFGTASWNISAAFKQLVFSTDADGTKHVDALAQGVYYDLTALTGTKAIVNSHFILHTDGSKEVTFTITKDKSEVILNSQNSASTAPALLLPGGLLDITAE